MSPTPQPRLESAASRELRAGRWELTFERATGSLRNIRWHSNRAALEVLRGIYVAVRDHNWNTLPVSVEGLSVEQRSDRLRVAFEAVAGDGHGAFEWSGGVSCDAGGTLRFEMDGVVRAGFRRNRIGFCVLHGAGCAGQPCVVETVDGARRESRFPRWIAARQPFTAVRTMTHQPAPGVRVEVVFEGETFETEDQRNWTDASFKTYCTPLELPFPVAVKSGDRVRQAITVRLREDAVSAPGRVEIGPVGVGTGRDDLILTIHPDRRAPFPALGLGASSSGEVPTASQAERLASLALSHLRVELDLGCGEWPRRLESGLAEARALGVPIELAVFVTGRFESDLATLEAALAAMSPQLRTLIVVEGRRGGTGAACVRAARRILGGRLEDAPLVSGTDAYFAQLNRERPPIELLDGVCYSMNPQVHAFDDESLIETLPIQGLTVRSAREFCGALPVFVSPVTLRPRFNPTATGPARLVEDGALPSEVDARQASPFAAAWTVGSLKHLSSAGVDSVTYYETVGWRGVMERAGGSALPEAFPSNPGDVFPVCGVFDGVGGFSRGEALQCDSSHPGTFDALVVQKGGRRRALLANYGSATLRVRVRLEHGPGDSAPEESIPQGALGAGKDGRSGRDSMRVELPPHAVVRVDLEEEP